MIVWICARMCTYVHVEYSFLVKNTTYEREGMERERKEGRNKKRGGERRRRGGEKKKKNKPLLSVLLCHLISLEPCIHILFPFKNRAASALARYGTGCWRGLHKSDKLDVVRREVSSFQPSNIPLFFLDRHS